MATADHFTVPARHRPQLTTSLSVPTGRERRRWAGGQPRRLPAPAAGRRPERRARRRPPPARAPGPAPRAAHERCRGAAGCGAWLAARPHRQGWGPTLPGFQPLLRFPGCSSRALLGQQCSIRSWATAVCSWACWWQAGTSRTPVRGDPGAPSATTREGFAPSGRHAPGARAAHSRAGCGALSGEVLL